MVWPFTLLAVFSVLYLLHTFIKVDPRAVLAGLLLVPLALCMEFLNQWIGPFWIAQESVYLILTGLPVEKLILYVVGGTFACATLADLQSPEIAKIPPRWLGILAIGLLMASLEFMLNSTEVFRWVRPWTVVGASIYYCVGGFLLFRFYDGLAGVERRLLRPFDAERDHSERSPSARPETGPPRLRTLAGGQKTRRL